MAIQPATRLGPYEILSAIGAGGMGEVYKGRDTRLDRIVAIKVLPAHLADKPELRERFEREARTIASLNHPHICTLHDIGRQDGTDFLVMEYLEGETLASRLLKGPLPLGQVLQYAIEISDALDKAHRKGVTHRDIKPGNVMLTKSGTKLLDFGLAKLKQAATPAATPVSQLPTLSHNPTAEGTILGTLQYMAPEQVEGKNDEIDARTDIFALGAVVYEMATGKKAFEGKTNASVMGAILHLEPPPMSSLQPVTPPALDRLVRRCLVKEPDERCQSAKDLCDELKWIAEGGAQVAPLLTVPATGIRALGRRPLIFGLGALLLGAVMAGVAIWNLKPTPAPPPRPVVRTIISLPAGTELAGLGQSAIAISPDGKQVAFIATRGGIQQLYLRAMDSLEARAVPGTDQAINPFFSPDGQWVGFFARNELKKVPTNGGAVQTVGAGGISPGAAWSSQGMIALSPDPGSDLQQVSDAGGAPQPLTRLENGESSHGWPEFLPGGRAVLFAAALTGTNWSTAKVAVQSLGTGARRDLVPGGTQPRYAPSGHLVYAQGSTLMVAPFDSQRLEVTGAAVPAVEGVLQSAVDGPVQYSFSDTGSLIYVAGGSQSRQSKPMWVTRSGTEQPLAIPARNYLYPRLSPDGRRVAISIEDQQRDIWLYDFSRETLTRFTFEGGPNDSPAWTPDGKRIAFSSGPASMFWQLADGSGGREQLATIDAVPRSWSPDGQLLAFVSPTVTTKRDIWVLRMSDRKAEPFLRTPFNETVPAFSPDGRWLAYASDESGRYEIYVRPYPGPGGKWQISTAGGEQPVWNPNGRELFYRSGDKMMAVEIATEPGFAAGKPRVLFEGPYATQSTYPDYDVSPDGQRFLMLKPAAQAEEGPTQINVVLNWFEDLKRLAPTRMK